MAGDLDTGVPSTASPVPVVYQAPPQHKPWGTEHTFAAVDGHYVGKIVHVSAGQALSLHYHEEKDETVLVLSGDAVISYGPLDGHVTERVFAPGDTVHFPARVVHRISAITDLVFAEAATARPGWREDVVRLEDDYGRSGTTAP